VSEKTAIQRIKELDQERATLFEQAKEEALRCANQAVEDLNSLGLKYRLVTDTAAEGNKAVVRSLRKQASQALTRNVRPGHRKEIRSIIAHKRHRTSVTRPLRHSWLVALRDGQLCSGGRCLDRMSHWKTFPGGQDCLPLSCTNLTLIALPIRNVRKMTPSSNARSTTLSLRDPLQSH
jgi:hypothetical protein